MTDPAVSRCAERSGFLFAHDCEEPPQFQCKACGKFVCNRHCYHDERGEVCLGCHKQRPGVEGAAKPAKGRAADDDPFFYGAHAYPDYLYFDSRDYRSFDASADAGQAGLAEGFEKDFDGS